MKTIILTFFILLGYLLTSAQYNKLLDFTGTANGASPYGSLITDGTWLYGTTAYGGANGLGLVFKIKPDGTGYIDILDFNGLNGNRPWGTLFYDGTYLYGTTSLGGTSGNGVVFKIKPDGTGYSDILEVNSPYGALISDGTFLYGMAYNGGSQSEGYVFKVKPDGTGFLDFLDFDGSNGGYPYGSLISDGTWLYGMTSNGGTSNTGVLFKVKKDGTGYFKLFDFTGPNGSFPEGSLLYDGTYLYGMAASGGSNVDGLVFKVKPDGTGFADLLDFDGTNGSLPEGSLITDGTWLYGMTSIGNPNNPFGTVFKIKPDGSGYADLFDFDGSGGKTPYADLLAVGSSLYGMTVNGGSNSDGIIFSLAGVSTGINEHAQNEFSLFPNPSTGNFTVQLSTATDNGKLEIYNTTGEEVYQQQIDQPSITVSQNLSPGIYFVKVSTGTNTINKKLIIQ
jgi:uncharacterized repeat protein (TIGR03803 family)